MEKQEKLQHRSRVRTIETVSQLLMAQGRSYPWSSHPSREKVNLQLRRPLLSNLTLRNNPLATAWAQALQSKLARPTMPRSQHERPQKVESERSPAKKRQKKILARWRRYWSRPTAQTKRWPAQISEGISLRRSLASARHPSRLTRLRWWRQRCRLDSSNCSSSQCPYLTSAIATNLSASSSTASASRGANFANPNAAAHSASIN